MDVQSVRRNGSNALAGLIEKRLGCLRVNHIMHEGHEGTRSKEQKRYEPQRIIRFHSTAGASKVSFSSCVLVSFVDGSVRRPQYSFEIFDRGWPRIDAQDAFDAGGLFGEGSQLVLADADIAQASGDANVLAQLLEGGGGGLHVQLR